MKNLNQEELFNTNGGYYINELWENIVEYVGENGAWFI